MSCCLDARIGWMFISWRIDLAERTLEILFAAKGDKQNDGEYPLPEKRKCSLPFAGALSVDGRTPDYAEAAFQDDRRNGGYAVKLDDRKSRTEAVLHKKDLEGNKAVNMGCSKN